jgi:hypothetical protein
MTPLQVAANPFALMTNPEAIFAAMATSDRLQRLNSRMCRPLDKVQPPKPDDASLRAADDAIEAAVAAEPVPLEPIDAEPMDVEPIDIAQGHAAF